MHNCIHSQDVVLYCDINGNLVIVFYGVLHGQGQKQGVTTEGLAIFLPCLLFVLLKVIKVSAIKSPAFALLI